MRRISEHVYTEIYYWGCNPSFVTTKDGVFMIDTPQQPINALQWREKLLEHGRPLQLVNTEPHPDHIMGNAYFPSVEVLGQIGMVERYAESVAMMSSAERLETMKQTDPDSVWLFNHPGYPPNPPTRTFVDQVSLEVGGQKIELLHHPGHTPPQTSVFLVEDGVVFTGDNVFYQCKTFIQEADPWQWLEALRLIEALDAAVIVPGHGEPCDKKYLRTQAQIIQSWVGAVEMFVQKGLTEDEAVEQRLDVRKDIDPFPIGQRLFPIEEALNSRIVRNLYPRIAERLVQPAKA